MLEFSVFYNRLSHDRLSIGLPALHFALYTRQAAAAASPLVMADGIY